MEKINTIVEEIAETLNSFPIENREAILHEEIDRHLIYKNDIWDILNDARPSSFYIEISGLTATTPELLAYHLIYDTFLNRFNNLIQ